MSTLPPLLGQLSDDLVLKGKQFEKLVKWFLENSSEFSGRFQHVWLWYEWPDRPGPDLGVDIVAKTHNGQYWAFQAKAYGPQTTITKEDVDGFLSGSSIAFRAANSRDLKRVTYFERRVLISSTDKISSNAKSILEMQRFPVRILLYGDLVSANADWPTSINRLDSPPEKRRVHKPRDGKNRNSASLTGYISKLKVAKQAAIARRSGSQTTKSPPASTPPLPPVTQASEVIYSPHIPGSNFDRRRYLEKIRRREEAIRRRSQ